MAWIVLYRSIPDFDKFLNPLCYLCENVTNFYGVSSPSGNTPLLLYAFLLLVLYGAQQVLPFNRRAQVDVRLIFVL
jgi:hypothetical protein